MLLDLAEDLRKTQIRYGERIYWLTGDALPKILEGPGVSAAHLCEADVETTTVRTTEKDMRDKPDEVARWVVLVEGSDADIVGRACREALDAKTLEAHGRSRVPSSASTPCITCCSQLLSRPVALPSPGLCPDSSAAMKRAGSPAGARSPASRSTAPAIRHRNYSS
jgi:hypothetical protein